MRINNTNSGVYTPGFEAKIHLNNKAILKNTPFHNELTPLDTMFKENFLVRGLNNFAIFVKSNILCKFFDKPRNKFEQELVKIQNKAIFFSRILADRILLMSHYSKIGRINKIIEEIKPDSKEYIERLAGTNKEYVKQIVNSKSLYYSKKLHGDLMLRNILPENVAKECTYYFRNVYHKLQEFTM